jgi:predicted alpha/beta hydrolase family esterase
MTASSDVTILFVPGLRDHVPDHWQTYMAKAIPGSLTVEPSQLDKLSRTARVEALDAAIQGVKGDIILVAHSAGVLMVSFWASMSSRRIRGALVVTPADVERPLPPGYPTPDELVSNGWTPIPRQPLLFPAIVVGSRNDPLGDFDRVSELARDWRADFHDGGDVGHLNPAAGFGPWEAGRKLLDQLVAATA